ncbi:MAG: fluoride efflux transporter CrcB [Gemmatimonadota bacterium]
MVALGGAIGAVLRYGVSGWIHAHGSASFPWGTLVVNVAGSFALGFAYHVLSNSTASVELRTFVTIGLLGAFTTFSTFSYEAVALLQDGDWGRGIVYVAGSVLLGLVGIVAGLGLAALTLQPGSQPT